MRGRETLLDASVSFLAPMGEDRRVKPFPAQQRADGSTAGSRVGFGQDLELVGGGEAPPLSAWSYFRVGVPFGAGLGGRSTALGLATLVRASFCGPQGRSNSIHLLIVHAGSLSRPAH